MKILEIKHLKKNFGDNQVLKDINLEVNKGDVLAILGPSGSGKSTLLRCATMLETMDSGDLIYEGEYAAKDNNGISVYSSKDKIREIKGKYGLVFQNFNLFPHYTVLKNVIDAPISVQKRNKEEVKKEAIELLSKVGLSGKEKSYPSQLSGGQQQRVAIARSLALKPDMIYFDEPTSALDPEITAEILVLLKELANEKMTMVIVTHEIDFARKVANKVVFMDNGYVVEQGTSEEVIDNPKNERTKAFLNKMSSN